MPLNYTHADGNGIFDFLGRVFRLMEQVNTSRGTDVASRVDSAIDQFKKDSSTNNQMELALAQAPQSLAGWQGTASSFLASWQQAASAYLRGVVARDATQPSDTLLSALTYLIAQMKLDGRYVDACAVGLSLAAAAGNSVNDLAILYSAKGGDGADRQNLIPEAIAIDLTSVSATSVSVRSVGKRSPGELSHEWPIGSGHSLQLSAADPDASLLTNGDLEDAAVANIPDDWLLLDGLPGTAYVLTDWEVQDLAIAGTPTSGRYYLRYTSPSGPVYMTAALAFDADAAAVQAALRLLPELSQVTVTSTGTTPNFTHRVTFVGVAGDLALLAAENQLDTGTITPSEITAGDADAYRGRSLKVVGSGAGNRRIYQELPTLTADMVYFVDVRHKKTGTPAAGSVRLAVVPGYNGAATQDSAGNNNSTSFDLTSGVVTTSYSSGWFSFRLKPTQAQPCYLEINVQDLSAGTTYCLDEIVVVQGTQLYAGGPFVAAVMGKTQPALADKWTLTATNDRAGSFQEWFARVFGMRSLGLLLPTSGSVNVPDALIA